MTYGVDDLFLQIEASETGTSPALALPQWQKTYRLRRFSLVGAQA
jgi:hypothetical protein